MTGARSLPAGRNAVAERVVRVAQQGRLAVETQPRPIVVLAIPLAIRHVRERRGPRVGAPDNAVQGFLKGAGLASLDQAEKRDTGKGEFWFAVITRKGGPTEAALPGVLDAALKALPWPKSMKWGSGTMQWVRPLQSIVALFDGKVLAGPKDKRPVSEVFLHTEILRARPDVNSVAHFHHELTTVFTLVEGLELKLIKNHAVRWVSGIPVHQDPSHVSDPELGRSLAATLDRATGSLLEHEKSPARRLGQLDNRGSHFYLALYWAQELAAQTEDPALAERFAPLAAALAEAEGEIVAELTAVQGSPADIGGYYAPDPALTTAVMRPSPTLNAALAQLG